MPNYTQLKKKLLKLHHTANVGHVGGNLSVIDALLVLGCEILKPEDHFILSKGHSAGALYITLNAMGIISDSELNTFYHDNTRLPAHPPVNFFDRIPFATGSLGHGLSLASGFALSRKLRGAPGHMYCICSDGEWQEGSTWEALIFACRHNLTNLTILVDHNGLQGYGTTASVAAMDPLKKKLEGFPLDLESIDGHDADAIRNALAKRHDQVRFIILNTQKARGVPGLEGLMKGHYLPLTEEQYQTSLSGLDRG